MKSIDRVTEEYGNMLATMREGDDHFIVIGTRPVIKTGQDEGDLWSASMYSSLKDQDAVIQIILHIVMNSSNGPDLLDGMTENGHA